MSEYFRWLLLITAISLCAVAQNEKPLTNDDVIKMVQAEIKEPTILKTIEANATAFDTSALGVIALKKAGVSETIINAMLASPVKRGSPEGASGSSALQGTSPTPRVRMQNGDTGGHVSTRPTVLPALYVEEVSSEGSVMASSDTTLEAIKTLQRKGMRLVTVKDKADYVLQITRQLGKHSWRKDTKIVLSNKDGEVKFTNSTRSVGGAMGGVAEYIRRRQE